MDEGEPSVLTRGITVIVSISSWCDDERGKNSKEHSFLSCPLSCAPLIHTPVCKTVTRPAQRWSDDTVRLRGLVTSVYTERVTVRLKEPLQTGRTRARRSYGHRRLAFHTRASAPTSCWAECVCGTHPS